MRQINTWGDIYHEPHQIQVPVSSPIISTKYMVGITAQVEAS